MFKNKSVLNCGRALLCLFWYIFGSTLCRANSFSIENHSNQSSFNREIINHFLSSGEKGILLSILGSPEFKSTRLQRTFHLSPEQNFSLKALIHSTTEHTLKYNVFCLIDYQQISFDLNGNTATSHPINVHSDEEQILSLTLPKLSNGKHDLLILFKQNNNSNTEKDEQPFLALSWRAVLNISEEQDFPSVSYSKVRQTRGAEKRKRSFIISQQNKACNTKCSISAEPAIIMGGKNLAKAAKFGVILFNDSSQISIKTNNQHPAYFYKATIGNIHKLKLPTALNYRQEKQLVWGAIITNPFTELETKSEALSTEPNETFISNTIAIQIINQRNSRHLR